MLYKTGPHEEVHRLARTMLRCLPRIGSVDIQALLPGSRPLIVGDHTFGSSCLARDKYNDATPAVAWRQARIRAAETLIGIAHTTRLTAALPLLDEAAELTHEIAAALVTGNRPAADFRQRRAALFESGRTLRPPLPDTQLGDTSILETQVPILGDNLSGTIIDIANNMIPRLLRGDNYSALAEFISNTIIGKDIPGAISEPWRLVGNATHPPSLDRLRSDLEDLRDVLYELARKDTNRLKIKRAALAGDAARSLYRAASVCRKAEERRKHKRRMAIRQACTATGLRTEIFDLAHGPSALSEYGVSIELDSVFDWDYAVATVTAALQADQLVGETYLLVPLRHSRPVSSLAMRLINDLHHEPDPAGLENLSQAHSSTLVDIFDQANSALQSLSGISELPDEQRDHDRVHTIILELIAELSKVNQRLSNLPDDRVTEALRALIGGTATRVQEELDGTSSEPSFASQIARLIAGETVDELTWVGYARYLAIEWDIDSQAAAEQFAETVD